HPAASALQHPEVKIMLELKLNGTLIETFRTGSACRLPNGAVVAPAQAGWSSAQGYTLSEAPAPEPVEPSPEELRAAMPPLSRRQVFIGLHRSGLISGPEATAAARTGEVPAAIEAVFATLPEPEATDARITFAAFTQAFRLDPTTLLLQAAGQLSDAELDEFFVAFAEV
uniref:hypothetical protein n=1 Tax=Phaeovulum sp. TaxID=2934796 RepID=UPI003569CBFE